MRPPSLDRDRVTTAVLAVVLGLGLWFHFGFEPDAGSHRIAVAVPELAEVGTGPTIGFHLGLGETAGAGEVDASGFEWDGDRLVVPSSGGTATYSGPVGPGAAIDWTAGTVDSTAVITVDGALVDQIELAAGTEGVEMLDFDVSLPRASMLLLLVTIAWTVLPARRLTRHLASAGWNRHLVGPIIVALLAAIAFMLVLPVDRARTQVASVEIEAIGPSVQGSAGAEVWVRITDPGGGERPAARLSDPRWIDRSPFVVGVPDRPPLVGRYSVGPDDRLDFASISHSGLAKVTVNGSPRVVDTFDDPQPIEFGDHATGPERLLGGLALATTAIGLGASILLARFEIGCWLGRGRLVPGGAGRDPDQPPPWWLIPQMIWTTALIILWPGLMSPDSLAQWNQLRSGTLDNWHPYTTTILMGVSRSVVDSPWLPILATLTVASLTLGQLARLAVDRGCPGPVAVASLVAASGSPALLLLGVVLWKDVIMGVAVLATILTVWSMLDDPRWLIERRRRAALAVAALSLVWLTRHNGWPIVVATLASIAVTRPVLRRQCAALGLAVVAIAFLINGPTARLLDVGPNPTGGIAFMQRISAHVQAGTPLADDERQLLESLRPLDQPWPYDCASVQPTWAGADAIPLDAYRGRDRELLQLMVELSIRSPGVELAHLGCSSRLVWQLSDQDSQTFLIEHGGHEAFLDTIPTWYTTSPMEAPPSRRLASALVGGVLALPSPLHRPAIYLYALLAATIVATRRQGSLDPVLIAGPAFFQTLSIAPFVLVQDTRFLFGTMVAAAALVPLLATVGSSNGRGGLSWDPALPGKPSATSLQLDVRARIADETGQGSASNQPEKTQCIDKFVHANPP